MKYFIFIFTPVKPRFRVLSYWSLWALMYYRFLGFLITNFGVFSEIYRGNTLKFEKITPKRWYYWYSRIFKSQFNWQWVENYSNQSRVRLGCLVTGRHKLWSTRFFGSLITNFGVFSRRYWKNTLKFAKTTPKTGYI